MQDHAYAMLSFKLIRNLFQNLKCMKHIIFSCFYLYRLIVFLCRFIYCLFILFISQPIKYYRTYLGGFCHEDSFTEERGHECNEMSMAASQDTKAAKSDPIKSFPIRIVAYV